MVTASIVIYRTEEKFIINLLDILKKSEMVSKVYLIDNSVNESKGVDSYKNYSFVEYIPHENTGYGSSHNIALKKAFEIQSDYHIILNPDITFNPEVIKNIVQYMDCNKDIGYLLPKVVYPDGEVQYLCKLLPDPIDLFIRRFFKCSFSQKKIDRYILKNSGYNKIMNPPCLSGCFMFLRCSTLKNNNLLFDERYFMYLEDFDLIRRIHKISKTIFYPYETIIHNHAQESYKSKKMLKIHIQSTIKYFNKWGWFFDKERKAWNKQILKEIENSDN